MNNLKYDVWLDVMRLLYNKTNNSFNDVIISDISFDLDVTYSHINNVVKLLCDERLIKLRKQNRVVIITLTKNGLIVGKLVNELYNIMHIRSTK